MIGLTIGLLDVVREGPRTPRRQGQYWCRCTCGTEILKRADYLKTRRGIMACSLRCARPPRRMTGAQQELSLAFLPMVRRIALKWGGRWPGLEDEIESAAQYGLVTAALDYRSDRGADFERYCVYRVLTTIRRSIRESRARMMCSLPEECDRGREELTDS